MSSGDFSATSQTGQATELLLTAVVWFVLDLGDLFFAVRRDFFPSVLWDDVLLDSFFLSALTVFVALFSY